MADETRPQAKHGSSQGVSSAPELFADSVDCSESGNPPMNSADELLPPTDPEVTPPELSPYEQTIRDLSDRLVTTQRPIQILNAIQWDDSIRQAFFDSGCQEQPRVDRDYYASRPLGFDPATKRAEFQDLERDVRRTLGNFNPVGVILCRMCREYEAVVRMLEARGTPEFSRISQQLYGSAHDAFHAGDPTISQLGVMMSSSLDHIDRSVHLAEEEKNLDAETAVQLLQARLNSMFPGPEFPVKVMISDGIVADASAGADYLKIRREARFSERDIRMLEFHEGWVHLATTYNGNSQRICTFLGKGPPSSTVTQEGLAILMEIFAFASHPPRLRKLTNRIRAVDLAESGATFRDVYQFFIEQGLPPDDSYFNSTRVFRGSTPTFGPFTKDLTYSKGFVLTYNYICLAVRKGLLERIPVLFCGKTTIEDLRTLSLLIEEGLVDRPRFLPPQFADLNAVAAWMCYSSFISRLSVERIEADYSGIL